MARNPFLRTKSNIEEMNRMTALRVFRRGRMLKTTLIQEAPVMIAVKFKRVRASAASIDTVRMKNKSPL